MKSNSFVATSQFTEQITKANHLLEKNDLNSAETSVVESLKLVNQDRNNHYKESVEAYKLLKKIYAKKNDIVNETAIDNFIIAILEDHGSKEELEGFYSDLEQQYGKKRIDEIARHKAKLKDIREKTKEELKQCSVPTKAPYRDNKESEDAVAFPPQQQSTTSIQSVYKNTSQRLREFVKDLIEESKREVPQKVTDILPNNKIPNYAIIAFGSLARDEATPYSDLEFGVLLDENFNETEVRKRLKDISASDANNQNQQLRQNIEVKLAEVKNVKNYFRELTKILNIKVINLGETTIRIQNLESLNGLTSPTKNGFSFDGQDRPGCKTPLGNLHHIRRDVKEREEQTEEIRANQDITAVDKERQISQLQQNIEEIKAGGFELIMTPIEMAELHSEEWYKKDKHISSALSFYSLLEGNSNSLDLINSYGHEFRSLLNLETLSENMESRENIRELRAKNLLKESLSRYSIRAGREEVNTRSFSAKYDFYRPVQMIISHLALYFDVFTNSTWEKFNILFVEDPDHGAKLPINSSFGQKNMRWLVDRIMQIRLQNYLANNSQIEDMSLTFNQKSPLPSEKINHLVQKGLGISKEDLFEIYFVMQTFERKATNFFSTDKKNELFLKEPFFDSSFNSRAEICILLLDFKAAIQYSENCLMEQMRHNEKMNHKAGAKSILYMIQCYNSLGMYEKSEQAIISLLHKVEKDDPQNLHMKLELQDKLINTQIKSGKYEDASANSNNFFNFWDKVKGVFANNSSFEHHYLRMLHNRAIIYQHLGKYEESKNIYHQLIELRKNEANTNPIAYATLIDDYGILCSNTEKYEEAISVHQKSLKIRELMFGSGHIETYHSLNNLANAHEYNKDYSKSKQLHERALDILEKNFGQSHPLIAASLRNLANVYSDIGDLEKAKDMTSESLKITISTLGEDHLDVAITKLNLASIYLSISESEKNDHFFAESLEKAKNYAKQSLDGFNKIGHSGHYQAISSIILGEICSYEGNYDNANEIITEAYNTLIKTVGENHKDAKTATSKIMLNAFARDTGIPLRDLMQMKNNTEQENELIMDKSRMRVVRSDKNDKKEFKTESNSFKHQQTISKINGEDMMKDFSNNIKDDIGGLNEKSHVNKIGDAIIGPEPPPGSEIKDGITIVPNLKNKTPSGKVSTTPSDTSALHPQHKSPPTSLTKP